jgi:hypothetical protein
VLKAGKHGTTEMPSIHFHCRATAGGGHLGLSAVDPTHHRSECWFFLPSMRSRLDEVVGGWIYLHERKDQPSYIGGVVTSIDPCTRKRQNDGVAFIFEQRPEGQGQTWRGVDNAQAVHGWIVPFSFPHER